MSHLKKIISVTFLDNLSLKKNLIDSLYFYAPLGGGGWDTYPQKVDNLSFFFKTLPLRNNSITNPLFLVDGFPYYQLSFVSCLVSGVYCHLLPASCLLSAGKRQVSTVYWLLSGIYCQLVNVKCILSIVYCQVSSVRCLLSYASCQLSTVRCLM